MTDLGTSKSAIQQKVKRFVEGRRSPRDLDAIFLWIRSKTHGLKTVKDIGDFVAHAEEKDTGVIWDNASLISAMGIFLMLQISRDPLQNYTEQDLAVLKASALAAVKIHDPSTIKKDVGFSKDKAKSILKAALGKFSIIDGKLHGEGLLPKEVVVFDYYSRRLIVRPAYDDVRLVSEFAECLVKNGLLEKGDVKKITEAGQYIAVYAVEKMHLCNLIFEGRPASKLFASVAIEDHNLLSVVCETNGTHQGKPQGLLTEVFTTSCRAEDWVDGSLWQAGQSGYWDVPLELTNDGKLAETN